MHAGKESLLFHSLRIPRCPSKPTLNPNTSTSRDFAIFNRFAVHTLGRCSRDDIVAFRSESFIVSFLPFSRFETEYKQLPRKPE